MPLTLKLSFRFCLKSMKTMTQERIEKAEVIEILRLTESYVFRRAICRVFQRTA